MIALWLLACRATDTDSGSPASTPVPTVDTDTDVTDTDVQDPENWDFHVTQLYGFGDSIAILETHPEILVAIVRAGENGQDGVRLASGAVYALDPDQQTITARVVFPEPATTTLEMTVEAMGDITQDGSADLGIRSGDPFIEPGPFDSVRPPTTLSLSDPPYACEGDGLPPPDLCFTSGMDFGPFDGQQDVVWSLGSGFTTAAFGAEAVFLRRWENLNFPRIIRVPLELRGTVEVDEQPTWEPTGFQIAAFAVVDTHVDGTEDLLVCGTQDDVPGLRLLDAFPADSPVRMTFDATCDALEVADFTGDGLPEVAVGAGARVRIVDPRTWTVLAEHEGTFQPVPPLQDGYGRAMDSADLNGDGRMDLILGAPWVGRIYVLTEVVPQGVDP